MMSTTPLMSVEEEQEGNEEERVSAAASPSHITTATTATPTMATPLWLHLLSSSSSRTTTTTSSTDATTRVDEKIQKDSSLTASTATTTHHEGFHVLSGILTATECNAAMNLVDDFLVDTGYCQQQGNNNNNNNNNNDDERMLLMIQSHGAGFLLGNVVDECLADRVFEPLYGTLALHTSKEGFVVVKNHHKGACADATSGNNKGNNIKNSHHEPQYYSVCKQSQQATTKEDENDGPLIRSLVILEHGERSDNDDEDENIASFLYCPPHVSFPTTTTTKTTTTQSSPLILLSESEIRQQFAQSLSYNNSKVVAAAAQPRRVKLHAGDVLLWRSDATLLIPLSLSSKQQQQRMVATFCSMLPAKLTPLTMLSRKMDAYKERRTGDYRPHMEVWHDNDNDNGTTGKTVDAAHPTRRQFFRTSPPLITVRQAELYGLLPYDSTSTDDLEKTLERAIVRGVRFVDPCDARSVRPPVRACPARLEKLEVALDDDDDDDKEASATMQGADKWLGGMTSPCGRFIYGVPGTARRVLRIATADGRMDCIGPEFGGKFKWLRGVQVPAGPAYQALYPSGCCLALPCNHASILKIDPQTSRVYAFGQDVLRRCGATNWLYHGGNLASNGWVYAIPANAERVLKFHPFTDEVQFIGPAFQGKAKWYGGIVGSDGCIWGVPHNHSMVLRIDPQNDQVTLLGQGSSDSDRQPLPDGRWKWHGGLRAGDKIIGFPNNSDSVLIINCSNKHVYTIDDSSILRSGRHRIPQDNRYKYLGGALTKDGRYAYLFPCDAEQVLRVDCFEDKLCLVGPLLLEGENKFQNGFAGRDGALYGIPQRSSGVLRIVPGYCREEEDHVDIMDCGTDLIGVKDKFEGGVLGADGCIYCIPLRAEICVKIVP